MLMDYNYETVLKWHPEMILISKHPFKWQGFLIISCQSYSDHIHNTQCPRVKLKLVVPNYPSLSDTQITFGKQIATLRNKQFSKTVKKLLNTTVTVSSFLTQLQIIINKHMHSTSNKMQIINLSMTDFLQELKAALQTASDVRLSFDRSLYTIKLFLRDVSLTLQRNWNTEVPWKVVSSDLPTISVFEAFEKNITNLNVAMTKFEWQVELLEKAWEQLKKIDENYWIIDPVKPNKSHMYRRIHLSQSVSVTITIDPLNPTILPILKFSGTDSEVKKQTDHVSNNILNWDQSCDIVQNLRMLLNMYEFPDQQESLEDNAVIDNGGCGICFCLKLDDDRLPDKICNNDRCMRHYHSACLSRWLQTIVGNQVVFNYIHGACPHCKENISCPIE